MTGIVTASWMPLTSSGSDMRATPPSRRMSAGTRSSAMTAAAPASSAIFACSAVTTSMITPPLSISARPAFTRKVATSFIATDGSPGPLGRSGARSPIGRAPDHLLEPESLDAIRVCGLVQGVDPVGDRLDHAQERRVRAHVGGAVRRVVEPVVGELGDLGEGGIGDRDRRGAPVAGQLESADHER